MICNMSQHLLYWIRCIVICTSLPSPNSCHSSPEIERFFFPLFPKGVISVSSKCAENFFSCLVRSETTQNGQQTCSGHHIIPSHLDRRTVRLAGCVYSPGIVALTVRVTLYVFQKAHPVLYRVTRRSRFIVPARSIVNGASGVTVSEELIILSMRGATLRPLASFVFPRLWRLHLVSD